MADVCVLFLSDDKRVTRELVNSVGSRHSVWSSDEMVAGDWEEAVRAELPSAKVVVVVISDAVKLPRAQILFDELRLVKQLRIPIIPFRIGSGDMPLGMGALTEVTAHGTTGKPDAAATENLLERIGKIVFKKSALIDSPPGQCTLAVGDKRLELPAFIFSASSFETQISPAAAIPLLTLLQSDAVLVSAYDVWVANRDRRDSRLLQSVQQVVDSSTLMVLDSGNYEAARIRAVVPRRSGFRWTRKSFHATCARVQPDAAFSFDQIPPHGPVKEVARAIVSEYKADYKVLKGYCRELWPIVHLPRDTSNESRASVAAALVFEVARRTKARLIAIPERELGDDLRARITAVTEMRESLDTLDERCALHILGTGNPIAINALAAAGADSFDGLEWCRTVTDYDRGFLFHFRHLNLFEGSAGRRVRGAAARQLLDDPTSSYELRALTLNIDYWQDLARSMQSLVSSGRSDALARALPFDGPSLFATSTSLV